jgi:hypothetical protein
MNEHILLVLVSLHFNPNFKLEYKIKDFVFPRLVVVFYFNTTKDKHDDELCGSLLSITHQKKRRQQLALLIRCHL